MDEPTLIENFQSYLKDRFDVAVRTSALEDERPMPAIILDDWNIEDLLYHNTSLVHHRYGDIDGDGEKEIEQVHRFHYEGRLEFVVRHTDEVEASELKAALKMEFRKLRDDPCKLHDHVKWLRPMESGDPTYHFREPKENELHAACLLESFAELRRTTAATDTVGGSPDAVEQLDVDPIEVIQNEFTIEE